ncbi:MAG: hypothetical protein JO321_11320 [Solirubrobacterales bacterium]|nr:hypothetical protein [Solirubrobacterales bacterium]MBV9535988.1 hypothetical protein [Solirubrobacterales bacterium]
MADHSSWKPSRHLPKSAPPPDEAHDILAAEEFAMPAPDPDLHHHDPVLLPEDPTGIAEPHDVLAAEEFPIPAVAHRPPPPTGPATK